MLDKLVNLTLSDECLDCNICCRFLDNNSDLKPKEFSLKKEGSLFFCENFNPANNSCIIYKLRPLDCKIYPFVITKSENNENILLAIDSTCPLSGDILKKINFTAVKFPLDNILPWQETFIPVKVLAEKEINNGLNRLNITDRFFFNSFLPKKIPLSAYTFAYHFMWEDYFEYYWKIINGSFCLFAKYGKNIFMPMQPLNPEKGTLKECFNIMESYNKDKNISRIENASKELKINGGFTNEIKDEEYIYLREDLVKLHGDKYKSIRWLCNAFEKENKYIYEEYEDIHLEECVNLLNTWIVKKTKKAKTNTEEYLLKHTDKAHKKTLIDHRKMDLLGRILKINGKISAYTFGAEINDDTFCVFLEVSDPEVKGASQFIFRELCRELVDYKYINTMGDEGIESLKLSKTLYHPVQKEPGFTVKMTDQK